MQVLAYNLFAGVTLGVFIWYCPNSVAGNNRKKAEMALAASERTSETKNRARNLLKGMSHGKMSYICQNIKSGFGQEHTDFKCSGAITPRKVYYEFESEQHGEEETGEYCTFRTRLICCHCPVDVIPEFYIYPTNIEDEYVGLIQTPDDSSEQLVISFKRRVEAPNSSVVTEIENSGRRAAEQALVASEKTLETKRQAVSQTDSLNMRGLLNYVCQNMRSGFGQERVTSAYTGTIPPRSFFAYILEKFPENRIDDYMFTHRLISCTCHNDAISEFFVYATYIENEYIGLVRKPNARAPSELWIVFKKYVT